MVDELTEESLTREGANVKGIDWVFTDPDAAEYEDEFEPDEKDPVEREREIALLKGLLWNASQTLVDHMFDDLTSIAPDRVVNPTYEPITYVLDMLPPRFAAYYDTLFARMFLVAIVDVTARITGTWSPLPTVAHELALRLLLNEAESTSELMEVDLPEGWRSEIEEQLFEDVDHEFLYYGRAIESLGEFVGMTPMDIGSWFSPFNSESRPSPYATRIDGELL